MKTLNRKTSYVAKRNMLSKFIPGLVAFMVSLSMMANPPAPGSLAAAQEASPAGKSAADLTDEEITEAVELELTIQDGVHSYGMDVSTMDGIVTISGETDNILEKDRATKIAKL